jgi:hypothetical protein
VIWKRPALPDHCWFAGKDWALSRDETPCGVGCDMLGSDAAHSVRRRRQARANPRSFLRAAMASFDGGEAYQMVGDLRPTVGTTLRFRQNREKQDPFEAPGNAARRQPDSSKDAAMRKQMFNRTAPGAIRSLGAA